GRPCPEVVLEPAALGSPGGGDLRGPHVEAPSLPPVVVDGCACPVVRDLLVQQVVGRGTGSGRAVGGRAVGVRHGGSLPDRNVPARGDCDTRAPRVTVLRTPRERLPAAGPGNAWGMPRILVAVDGSEASDRAAAFVDRF